jgi:hypothetical protein
MAHKIFTKSYYNLEMPLSFERDIFFANIHPKSILLEKNKLNLMSIKMFNFHDDIIQYVNALIHPNHPSLKRNK